MVEAPLLECQAHEKEGRTLKRRSSINLTYSPHSAPNKIVFPFDLQQKTFTLDSFNPAFLNKTTTERDIQKFLQLINETCGNFQSLGPLYERFKNVRNLYIGYICLMLVTAFVFLVLEGMQVDLQLPAGIVLLCIFVAFLLLSLLYYFVDKSFKDELLAYRKKINILIKQNTYTFTGKLGVEWCLPEKISDSISWLELFILTNDDPQLVRKFSSESGEHDDFSTVMGSNYQADDRCFLEPIPEHTAIQMGDGLRKTTT